MNAAAALRRAGIASTAQQVSMVLVSSFPRRGLKRWMKSGSRMKKTSDAKSPSTSSSQVLQASSSPANSGYALVLQTPGAPSPAAAAAAHVGHALRVPQSGHETSQSGAASDRTAERPEAEEQGQGAGGDDGVAPRRTRRPACRRRRLIQVFSAFSVQYSHATAEVRPGLLYRFIVVPHAMRTCAGLRLAIECDLLRSGQ
jgi:hypothetical protein|eukprot:COSAG06_NODE_1339_length_9813_cov_44.214639_8_plen_200_part_00